MKGSINYDDTVRLLKELHQNREFEIFTAIESSRISKPDIYVANCNEANYTPASEMTWGKLEALNDQHRGIWFTANSMMYGKRKVEFIETFNAIVYKNYERKLRKGQ